MIHSATQTSKFRKLVRRLRSLVSSDIVEVETIAVGLLERLWHATMQEAKQGDIGRHDNETIADMMGWIALDCDQLIEILVETGWLDRSIEHRLLVHDWAEHCPAFIKKNISRWGGFLTPNDPHLSQLAATKRSSEPVSGDKTAQLSQLASTPNQTQPNQTKPNPTQPAQEGSFDFSNPDVFWDTQPIGWIAFDWLGCQGEFIRQWNLLPGVIPSRLKAMPSDAASWFEERWASAEWRLLCRLAFEQMINDRGLQSGTRLPLKRWLAEESLVSDVLGGRYNFTKDKPNAEKRKRQAVRADDYGEGGADHIPAEIIAASHQGRSEPMPETDDGL